MISGTVDALVHDRLHALIDESPTMVVYHLLRIVEVRIPRIVNGR